MTSNNLNLGDTVTYIEPITENQTEVEVKGIDASGDVLVEDSNGVFWADPSTLEKELEE